MKTKIIVKESNLEKIEAIITEVEGRAQSRCIGSDAVLYIAEVLDKKLLALVCKKNLKGTRFREGLQSERNTSFDMGRDGVQRQRLGADRCKERQYSK